MAPLQHCSFVSVDLGLSCVNSQVIIRMCPGRTCTCVLLACLVLSVASIALLDPLRSGQSVVPRACNISEMSSENLSVGLTADQQLDALITEQHLHEQHADSVGGSTHGTASAALPQKRTACSLRLQLHSTLLGRC